MKPEYPLFLYFSIVGISFLTVLFITPLVKRLALNTQIVDKPETRKIHTGVVPRMGGIGIFLGVAFSLFLFYLYNPLKFISLFSHGYQWVLIGAFCMLILGIIDDKIGLDAKIKFTVQFAVAIFVVIMGLRIENITNPFGDAFHLGIFSYPLTVLWIVGVTNAINLSDGLDGLASGISLIVVITMFAVSLITGHPATLVITAALCGALIGFLRYNFNPAQIFMGDTGSLFLGFSLATISIKGSLISSTTASLLIPFIALGLPIIDTLFAIVRRVITRMNPFSADTEHVHHKLLSFGLNQRQTVILLYAICILFGLIAFLLTAARNETAAGLLFVFGIVIYVGIRRLGYVETILFQMKKQRDQNKKKMYHEMYTHAEQRVPFLVKVMSKKRIFEILLDFIFIAGSLIVTRIFLENIEAVFANIRLLRDQLIIISLCCYISFLIFGYYREMWKYINLDAIGKYVKGVSSAALLSYFTITFLDPEIAMPPHAFVILWAFLLVLISGSRLLFNFYANYQKRELAKISQGDRTLIYGAGDRGETVLSAMIKEDVLDYKPIGFIDDNPAKQNKDILGYTVLGDINRLEKIIIANEIQQIIISSRFINGTHESVLKDICRKHRVKLCHFRVRFDPVSVED